MILASPVFDLITFSNPYIYYSTWFFNAGGNGTNPPPANDTLVIELSNGQQTVVLEKISRTSGNMSEWINKSFEISDYLTPTATMTLKATATDYTPGNIVEAGLDRFYVEEGSGTGITETQTEQIRIYPNPSNGILNIQQTENSKAALEIFTATGQLIFSSAISQQTSSIDISSLSQGLYIVKLSDKTGKVCIVEKLIKN